MPRDPEPVARVRKARVAAKQSLAELQVKRAGIVERLRAVHPGILIGASVLAGFALARLLGGRRGHRAASAVRTFAPVAAIMGYLQSFMWRNAAQAAQRWWVARAHREEAAAAGVAPEPEPVGERPA
jgi:hypothetical protein